MTDTKRINIPLPLETYRALQILRAHHGLEVQALAPALLTEALKDTGVAARAVELAKQAPKKTQGRPPKPPSSESLPPE